MILPNTIKNKIRSAVKHAQASNELQQEMIDWFKTKGIDVDGEQYEGLILDPIVDACTASYNAEWTIQLIEETMEDIE